MADAQTNKLHPQPTQRRQLSYVFTTKHHGGDPNAARWLPSLTEDEEFAVFDTADLHEFSDDDEWLYGVWRSEENGLRYLGTLDQQMAEYPFARAGEPWHGYPLWPLKALGPDNRRGEQHRPGKIVFEKMEAAGFLTKRERKRLYKGDHV